MDQKIPKGIGVVSILENRFVKKISKKIRKRTGGSSKSMNTASFQLYKQLIRANRAIRI